MKANTAVVATFVNPRLPYVSTLPASGHAGSTVRLRFRVWSHKGMTSEVLTVGDGRSVLGTLRVPLRHVTYAHATGWTVPSTVSPGLLRFCAIATDKTGKRSPKACSLLKIAYATALREGTVQTPSFATTAYPC